MKSYYLLILFVFFFGNLVRVQAKKISGIVFNDKNYNGLFDEGDVPLSNIPISTMSSIVLTDTQGKYTISTETNDIIFVIKPENFKLPLKNGQNPDFYKIIYNENSGTDFIYSGIEKTNNLPKSLDFPLYEAISDSSFNAHIIGDIQTPTIDEVKYFRALIVPNLLNREASFGVCLGDIADDNLDVYQALEKTFSVLNMPIYKVYGNHDINYKSTNNNEKAETFRRHFGPEYYSFNYGNTHFITINTINYNGWNMDSNSKGSFTGGIDKKQLQWIKQDLELVPTNKRIVLLGHIPLTTNYCDSNQLAELFSLLEGRAEVLSLAGHTHTVIHIDYNKEGVWKGKGNFKGHMVGAACGGWWVSPYGNDSIPDATCNDGTPAGSYYYTFTDKHYNKLFLAGGQSSDFQLRISTPHIQIKKDSIESNYIIANIFDGNKQTKVSYIIDDNAPITMTKSIEKDPFIERNQFRRKNRDQWTPWVEDCYHLWKAPYPDNLTIGMHKIKVNCTLDNDKQYSSYKIFEIVE